MRAELEPQDIDQIVDRLFERLKLLQSCKCANTDDVIFDVKSLKEYLKVSDKWIYERTHLKEIPHLKVDGLLRFRKKDIDKWLSSYNVPAVNTHERILKAVK